MNSNEKQGKEMQQYIQGLIPNLNRANVYNFFIITCYSVIYKTYFSINHAINGILKPNYVKKVHYLRNNSNGNLIAVIT